MGQPWGLHYIRHSSHITLGHKPFKSVLDTCLFVWHETMERFTVTISDLHLAAMKWCWKAASIYRVTVNTVNWLCTVIPTRPYISKPGRRWGNHIWNEKDDKNISVKVEGSGPEELPKSWGCKCEWVMFTGLQKCCRDLEFDSHGHAENARTPAQAANVLPW